MKSVASIFWVAVLALAFTVNNVSASHCEGKLMSVMYARPFFSRRSLTTFPFSVPPKLAHGDVRIDFLNS